MLILEAIRAGTDCIFVHVGQRTPGGDDRHLGTYILSLAEAAALQQQLAAAMAPRS